MAASETSELIVRDFLIKEGLTKTLEALNQECEEKARPKPTVEAWYEMSIAVHLPELLLKYNNGSKMEQCPIVEVILAHLRTLLGTTQKQPLDKSLLSSQRRLTNTGEITNIGEPTTNSVISEYGASQNANTEKDREQHVKPTITVLDSKGNVLPPASNRHPAERKSRLIQTSTSEVPSYSFRPKAGVPVVTEDKPPAPPVQSLKPKRTKEEEGGKHKEYYMPEEMRARMIHRSMEVLRKNEEEAARIETITKSNAARLKHDDLKKNHQEEAFQLKKKIACGLCEVKFSEVNLPVCVTLKAIYDLRHTWMLRRTAQLEAKKQAAIQARKTGSDNSDSDVISGDKEEDSKARVTTLVQNGAFLQPTRSYDQRRVCSFCAQFFESDEVYRPSFGAKLAKLQDEKRIKEQAEDNKFWDPLMNPITSIDTTSKKARQRRAARHRRIESELSQGRSLVSRHNPELDLIEGERRSGDGESSSSPNHLHHHSENGGPFFIAVKSHHRKGRSAVHGHNGSQYKPSTSLSKSLSEVERDEEAKQFREAASMSAFWHADATNTLMTKGMNSFKKTSKDRNNAKATVV